MRKTLKIGRSEWSYLDSGSGDEVWLSFHGYGQQAEVMHHFVGSLRPDARILSFDLPLHGETRMKGHVLPLGDIDEVLDKALLATGASHCSIIGFSLGGKVVLKMVELSPGKLEKIVLVAPDGLKINPLYWFVTNTLFGRTLFRIAIILPQPVLGTAWLLSKTRLMNPKVHAFVKSQMDTKAKREKVLDTWMMFRQVVPNLNQVSKRIWRYRLKLTLVFGKKDRVIHPKLAKKLSGENCKTAKVVIIDAGHNLTTKEHAEFLKSLIA